MCIYTCALCEEADPNKKLKYNTAFKGDNMVINNIKLDPAANTIVKFRFVRFKILNLSWSKVHFLLQLFM